MSNSYSIKKVLLRKTDGLKNYQDYQALKHCHQVSFWEAPNADISEF